MEHSTLPFHVGENHDYIYSKSEGLQEQPIASTDVGWRDHDPRANARFIVHACNNHYELLSLAEELLDYAKKYIDGFHDWWLLDRASAVILKAKPECASIATLK